MTVESNSDLRARRAAKQHQCHLFGEDGQSRDCTEFINAGDLYVENLDSAPAYHSGTRYCVPCAVKEFGVDPMLLEAERCK